MKLGVGNVAENNVERFERVLKEREHIYDAGVEQMKKVAEKLHESLQNPEFSSGLLYGRVQSGKTNNTIMCIAKLADENQFRLFIVLTSDNTSLYGQTLSRITAGLATIGVVGYKDISNGNETKQSFVTKLEHKGAVIVCTKNHSNLKKIIKFIQGLELMGVKAVIFDDEADFGSLNSKQNQEDESAVYSLIEDLRTIITETKFVEVTATPQANLLQKLEDPRHPSFIITIPPGKGYVGGDRLYDLESQDIVDAHHREIVKTDVELITKKNDPPADAPDSIYLALCTFFLGGAMKNISSQDQANFSMLVHISSSRKLNNTLYSLVIDAKDRISRVLHHEIKDIRIEKHLKDAYKDIIKTLKSNKEITYEESLANAALFIDQGRPQKVISGKSTDDPNYDSFYNILIGGNRLSRGLTVKNLTVFYYARASGAPKVDTILQHSRIYGYRENVLDIIRIFATDEIFENLYDAYKSDQEEWEYIETNDPLKNPPVFLYLKSTNRISPTHPQVTPNENLIKYFPGRTYFLYHAKPSNVAKIDELLKDKDCKSMDPAEIDFEVAKKLIELTDSCVPNQRWNKEALKIVLDNMKKRGSRMYIIVRKNSNLKKDYRAVLSGQNENNIWKDDGPILFMYKTSGKGEGWNGEMAWIPVLRVPKEYIAYYLASDAVISKDVGEE